jgi:hypothetical protein
LGANLAVGNDNAQGAVQVAVQAVDHNFFPTLGVAPVVGRNFTADEDRATGPKAIILSYGLWQKMFGGDRDVVDRVVHLNGESLVIAGVMPESMAFGSDDPRSLSPVADVWQPLKLDEKNPGYPGKNYNMIARLRDGVAQAQEEVATLDKPLYQRVPYLKAWLTVSKELPVFIVWPLRQVMVSNVRSSIVTLTAAVVAVLLVAPESRGVECGAGEPEAERDCAAQCAGSVAGCGGAAAAGGEFSAGYVRLGAGHCDVSAHVAHAVGEHSGSDSS